MPKPQLTVREAKLVKGIAAGKSQTQAAKDAGYSSKSAHVIASNALKKVNVQEALHAALEKHGITLDQAIAPIGKALTATKVQITGQGDQAFAELVEDIDLQLKGSDRALKLMGVTNSNENNVTVNFVNIAAEQKDLYDL